MHDVELHLQVPTQGTERGMHISLLKPPTLSPWVREFEAGYVPSAIITTKAIIRHHTIGLHWNAKR